MNITNAKLNSFELREIYGINPIIGDIESLELYNSSPYFNIEKFYNNGLLVGYAVIFLGYNSISSPDASLEDVAFWQGTPSDLETFLKMVIAAKNYPLSITSFYFDPEKFDERIYYYLTDAGFQKTSRVR